MVAFRDWPIRRKLTALMLLSSGMGLLLTAGLLIGYAWQSARAGAEQDLNTAARIVADTTGVALAFDDAGAAGEMLAALRAKPEIEFACLYSGRGSATTLFASYVTSSERACPATLDVAEAEGLQQLATTVPIELKGERLGWLRITQNLHRLESALRAQVGLLLAILGASFVMSFGIAWAMQRLISEPLLRLAQTARRVSDSRDYRLRAPPAGRDEVGQLIGDFNQMLSDIAQRDAEVLRARDEWVSEAHQKARANQELAQTLQKLREAQQQLVQNEKLASLGALVAGVAHEINTPVGVGVTAASTLEAHTAQLRSQVAGGALRRSDLERYISLAAESSQIILKNLQRAAELIQSFKQVAVDQSSGERRRFGLRTYLDEVLLSLRPQVRKTSHRIEVDCPETLMVDSYPGAIAQILTNLVTNSLVHGFEGRDNGHIRVTVTAHDNEVTLRYTDDGRGIPKENLSRIFDPFFTTKRGSGGSGLGLHIVYNLVVQMLGGSIDATSEPGHGVAFVIRFPVSVHKAEKSEKSAKAAA